MLNFTVLIDNRINQKDEKLCRLQAEHGLSIFIEYNNTKILCDTGASGLFLSNAAILGIDPKEIGFCFISHGHSDHTGGLLEFMNVADERCSVYLSGQIEGNRFHSCRREKKREISTDSRLFGQYGNRLHRITGSCWITPDIAAVKISSAEFGKPAGNSFLTMEHNSLEQQDNFCHELALAIRTDDGVVIFSPCSHNGLLNIVESCLQFTGSTNLKAFIGGLHFVDGCEKCEDIETIATTFMERYPYAQLFTSHCTGDIAIKTLTRTMPGHILRIFGTGDYNEMPPKK